MTIFGTYISLHDVQQLNIETVPFSEAVTLVVRVQQRDTPPREVEIMLFPPVGEKIVIVDGTKPAAH